MLGVVIGNYQIIQKLGEGGMGAVYLGQHMLLGRRAAIKVLLPILSTRLDIVNRFFNEARAVTTINDPGIVQVFDFGYHTDGSAFIVIEFLEGEPLDRRLARLGKLPVHEALRLCRQIASSLAAAHARHIIHRDLKPENIFLVRDGEVASGERSKILDFGIAKLSDDHPGKVKTSTGAVMGTPMYMSPEQCRGLAELDHRSDIYALGCILFHLIAGRPPFEGEGMGDIIAAHIRQPAPVLSSLERKIAPNVDALVLRCLAKAPADRYQTMVELATAIGQVLSYRASPESPTLQVQANPGGATPVPSPYAGPGKPVPVPYALQPGTPPPVSTKQSKPTTLGSSVGQVALPPARSRQLVGWLAGAVLLGAVGIVIALVATRNHASTTTHVAAPMQDLDAGPLPPAIDAAMGATATTAVIDAEIPVVSPPDANPPDAVPADALSDAPAKRPHRPPSTPPNTGSSTVPSECDRSVDTDCDGIPDVR